MAFTDVHPAPTKARAARVADPCIMVIFGAKFRAFCWAGGS